MTVIAVTEFARTLTENTGSGRYANSLLSVTFFSVYRFPNRFVSFVLIP